MKKLFAALIIVLLLLLSSCAPVGEAPEDYYLDDSWGSVFRTYWNAMNDNYVFWDLDSPSDEWDLVYDKYAPLFDSYGKIDQNTDEAFASLLEISRMLSDGHYSIEIDLENGKSFFYYSYLSKLLENAGQEIKTDYFIYENGQPVLDHQSVPEVQQSEIFSENINNVLSFTFGISSNGNSISDEADGNLGRYFSDADAISYEDGTSYPFTGILGKTSDGIVYFGFDEFNFRRHDNSSNQFSKAINMMLENFRSAVTDPDTRGIIIDLRGNPGGYNDDIPLLWSNFTDINLLYMHERAKFSDNRLDYTPWIPIVLHPSEDGTSVNEKVPIVLLVNSGSGSNAEISTLIFASLKEEGRDVTIIGSGTNGAMGSLVDQYVFNSGSFTIENITCNIASVEHSDRNKETIEGKGIHPDVEITFDYNAFASGSDRKLDEAFRIIRAKI